MTVPEPAAAAFPVDHARLRGALRANVGYGAIGGAGVVLAVALAVVAIAFDAGRPLTFLLLTVLGIVGAGILVLALRMRARIRGFQRIDGPLLEIVDDGIVLAGVPLIPWGDMLGIVGGDSSADLDRGAGPLRAVRRLAYRGGGSQTFLRIGIDRPRRFRDSSHGPLVRYFDTALDVGGIQIPLDVPLPLDDAARVRQAVCAAASAHGVTAIDTPDTARITRAVYEMGRGKRMPRNS